MAKLEPANLPGARAAKERRRRSSGSWLLSPSQRRCIPQDTANSGSGKNKNRTKGALETASRLDKDEAASRTLSCLRGGVRCAGCGASGACDCVFACRVCQVSSVDVWRTQVSTIWRSDKERSRGTSGPPSPTPPLGSWQPSPLALKLIYGFLKENINNINISL